MPQAEVGWSRTRFSSHLAPEMAAANPNNALLEEKTFPKGLTMKILVTKRTNGNGRLVKGRPVTQRVVAIYQDGQVRTSSGDVWTAKPSGKAGVDLEAVL